MKINEYDGDDSVPVCLFTISWFLSLCRNSWPLHFTGTYYYFLLNVAINIFYGNNVSFSSFRFDDNSKLMMTHHYVLLQWRGTAVVWRPGTWKSSGTWVTATLELVTTLATVKPAGNRHHAS